MAQEFGVLLDLGVALAAACAGGLLAVRLRQSPIVGYLLAGVVIGPFTPGFVGNTERISALAEVGIIFLLFVLGVEFSIEELGRIRRIALVGTALQLSLTGAIAAGLGLLIGWTGIQSVYLGAIVALSSTVVILKTLLARGEVDSAHGRVLLGMLIVQDLAAVALMVVLPSISGESGNLAITLAAALFKALLFIGGTLLLGRLVPRLLASVARIGSQELFILATATLALGAALVATALGLSVALGAFLAGLIVGRSEVEHHALAQVLPLRDLFISLFFVSVGMLVDPRYAWEHPLLVCGVALAVIVMKVIVATGVAQLRAFHLSGKTALFVGLGLAQVGEFSYVLARQGAEQHVLTAEQYSLVLATSVLTLVATPALFARAPSLDTALGGLPLVGGRFRRSVGPIPEDDGTGSGWRDHVIVVGCGRVGSRVARALAELGVDVVGIDQDLGEVEALRREGIAVVYGDAGYDAVTAAAHPERARAVVVALPDLNAARVVVHHVREANPEVAILARAPSPTAVEPLLRAGARAAIEPEFEGGQVLLRLALDAVHASGDSAPANIRTIHYAGAISDSAGVSRPALRDVARPSRNGPVPYHDRMILGTCGELARRFGWKPEHVRLGVLTLAILIPGPSLVLTGLGYLALGLALAVVRRKSA